MSANKNGGVPATSPGGKAKPVTVGSTSAGSYGSAAMRTVPAGKGHSGIKKHSGK
jgi:hypothetical protein